MPNTFVERRRPVWRFITHRNGPGLILFSAILFFGSNPATAQNSKVVVDDDGTVHVPEQAVPISSYLSPEARAYVTQHLKDVQNPEAVAQDNGVPRFMKGYLERQKSLYPVDREDTKIAGVHVYVYTPKAGVAEANRTRVLINLHGGGFSGCWPGCAELESIPIAALGRIRVVSVDYREGPDYKFPAASEDVAAVYKEILKNHAPESVGIYGCSAGGMLTAMSVAWFQKHDLTAARCRWNLLCGSRLSIRSGVRRRRELHGWPTRRGPDDGPSSAEIRQTRAQRLRASATWWALIRRIHLSRRSIHPRFWQSSRQH